MNKLLTTTFCLLLGLSLLTACGGSGSAIPLHTSPPPPSSPPTPSSHLYLWDSAAVVNPQYWIYHYALPITPTSQPVAKIADGGSLNVLAFDTTHRLFVTQNQSVQVFTQLFFGSNSDFILATNESNPQDVKIDSAGDALVSGTNLTDCHWRGGCNSNVAEIDVFSAPVTSSSTVNFRISVGSKVGGWTRPVGIAIDGSGDLWAGTNDTMFEYTPPFIASSVPAVQFPISFNPSDLAFDSAGNMYAAGPGGVVVYNPPFTASTTKAFTISTADTAYYLTFDAAGNLYVTTGNANGNGVTPKLLVFSPPFNSTSAPVVALTLPGTFAAGIAIGP